MSASSATPPFEKKTPAPSLLLLHPSQAIMPIQILYLGLVKRVEIPDNQPLHHALIRQRARHPVQLSRLARMSLGAPRHARRALRQRRRVRVCCGTSADGALRHADLHTLCLAGGRGVLLDLHDRDEGVDELVDGAGLGHGQGHRDVQAGRVLDGVEVVALGAHGVGDVVD